MLKDAKISTKYCGKKEKWQITVQKLIKKTGSQGNIRNFRRMIKQLATHNHLPDYEVYFDVESDTVVVSVDVGDVFVVSDVVDEAVVAADVESDVVVVSVVVVGDSVDVTSHVLVVLKTSSPISSTMLILFL